MLEVVVFANTNPSKLPKPAGDPKGVRFARVPSAPLTIADPLVVAVVKSTSTTTETTAPDAAAESVMEVTGAISIMTPVAKALHADALVLAKGRFTCIGWAFRGP